MPADKVAGGNIHLFGVQFFRVAVVIFAVKRVIYMAVPYIICVLFALR